MAEAIRQTGVEGDAYIHVESFDNPGQWKYSGTASEYLYRIGYPKRSTHFAPDIVWWGRWVWLNEQEVRTTTWRWKLF